MICVVDAREPEAERAPPGAPWCIDAAALEPVASEALVQRAREGCARATVAGVTAASGRVSIKPPSRLATPGAAGEASVVAQPREAGSLPAAAHEVASPIRVEFVQPARSGVWRWLALAAAVAGALGWWLLRGGAA